MKGVCTQMIFFQMKNEKHAEGLNSELNFARVAL